MVPFDTASTKSGQLGRRSWPLQSRKKGQNSHKAHTMLERPPGCVLKIQPMQYSAHSFYERHSVQVPAQVHLSKISALRPGMHS